MHSSDKVHYKRSQAFVIIQFAFAYIYSLQDLLNYCQAFYFRAVEMDDVWHFVLKQGSQFLSKPDQPEFPSEIYSEVLSTMLQESRGSCIFKSPILSPLQAKNYNYSGAILGNMPEPETMVALLDKLLTSEAVRTRLLAFADQWKGPEPAHFTDRLEEWVDYRDNEYDWADANFMRRDFLEAGIS